MSLSLPHPLFIPIPVSLSSFHHHPSTLTSAFHHPSSFPTIPIRHLLLFQFFHLHLSPPMSTHLSPTFYHPTSTPHLPLTTQNSLYTIHLSTYHHSPWAIPPSTCHLQSQPSICPSSTPSKTLISLSHHMIPTTHIHISFNHSRRITFHSLLTCTTNPAPKHPPPSTLYHTLPPVTFHPFTCHQTPSFHHPHQPFLPSTMDLLHPHPPSTIGPATTITHGPSLPSIHRAPRLLTTHFPLFGFPASFICLSFLFISFMITRFYLLIISPGFVFHY